MSDIGHELYKETQAAKTLLAQIADIIGDDREAASDAVEGETSLNEAIDAAVQQLVDDTAAVRGLKSMIEDLTRRQVRVEERIKNFRTALAVALEQAGRKKIEHPAVTLSLRSAAQAVTVTDEAQIPSKFWVDGDPRLDKRAVLDALKAKQTVPGCALSNGGQVITLKWS